MEKVVNRLINESLVNVDRYNNNNSTWLIFTETKQWVIELTKDGTLWYNYNFFKNLFVYMSMDVVENQHYITKWVEDTIINGVKNTYSDILPEEYDWSDQFDVKEVIEIGVKHTEYGDCLDALKVLSLNGVKETRPMEGWVNSEKIVDKTIQNGVKNTLDITNCDFQIVEDVIKEGVKHTEYGDWLDGDERFDDIIKNGVKQTKQSNGSIRWIVEDTIQNGVKESFLKSHNLLNLVEDTIQNGVKRTLPESIPDSFGINDTIQNGIKETKGGGYLGSITMGGKLVHMVESPNQNNEVEDVIQHGVIETFDETHHRRREVVRTIKDGIKETIGEDYHHIGRIDGVIKNGIKQTKSIDYSDNSEFIVDGVISRGGKE